MGYCWNESEHERKGADDYRYDRRPDSDMEHRARWRDDDCSQAYMRGYDREERNHRERQEEERREEEAAISRRQQARAEEERWEEESYRQAEEEAYRRAMEEEVMRQAYESDPAAQGGNGQ